MAVRHGMYTALAGLLEYPSADFRQRLDCCRERLRAGGPLPAVPAGAEKPQCPPREQSEFPAEAAVLLAEFDAAVRDCLLDDLEELYTQNFDFSPQHTLEIGWQLFGDDYHRGAMLVRLRDELVRHDIPEVCELPDHLTYVLPLIDRMSEEEAHKFSRSCVLPAVDKIVASLTEKKSPYEHLLRCIALLLGSEFGREARTSIALPILQEAAFQPFPGHDP